LARKAASIGHLDELNIANWLTRVSIFLLVGLGPRRAVLLRTPYHPLRHRTRRKWLRRRSLQGSEGPNPQRLTIFMHGTVQPYF
jgi:hypothetical protein